MYAALFSKWKYLKKTKAHGNETKSETPKGTVYIALSLSWHVTVDIKEDRNIQE